MELQQKEQNGFYWGYIRIQPIERIKKAETCRIDKKNNGFE